MGVVLRTLMGLTEVAAGHAFLLLHWCKWPSVKDFTPVALFIFGWDVVGMIFFFLKKKKKSSILNAVHYLAVISSSLLLWVLQVTGSAEIISVWPLSVHAVFVLPALVSARASDAQQPPPCSVPLLSHLPSPFLPQKANRQLQSSGGSRHAAGLQWQYKKAAGWSSVLHEFNGTSSQMLLLCCFLGLWGSEKRNAVQDICGIITDP